MGSGKLNHPQAMSSRPSKGRAAWLIVLFGLLCTTPSCIWLQNETFVFDLAPPVAEPDSATEAQP